MSNPSKNLFVIGQLAENNTIINSYGFGPTRRSAYLEARIYMDDEDLDEIESYFKSEAVIGELYLFEITEALAIDNLKVGNNGMMFKNIENSNVLDIR